MIEFRKVSIQYVKEFFCLYKFDCAIKSNTLFVGDFFTGATSVMRILSKLDTNFSGECLIDNVNIKKIKNKELPIAYLPENPILFENKNIFYNLYFPLKIRKINKNITKNMINSIKNELFLYFSNNRIHSSAFSTLRFDTIKIKKLNLFEKKIIALIRAVLREPKIILLENFFENLDEKHLELALDILKKLKPETLIIATEKTTPKIEFFSNFDVVNLEK